MKKWLSLILTLCVMLSCLCLPIAAGADDAEPTNIELVTIWGGESAGHPAILEKINEILTDKLNATISYRYLDQPETQYSLLFAANDHFDLVFTCDWWYYFDYAVKNAFLELTDEMIQTYMPQNYANLPAIAWEQARASDGKIYMIPGNEVVMGARALILRDDLRQKYGMDPITTSDQFVEYLKNVAANETDIKAVSGELNEQIGYLFGLYTFDAYTVTDDVVIRYDDEKTALQYIQTPEFREAALVMKELADAGCWASDALAATTGNVDTLAIYSGTSATYVHNLPSCGNLLKSLRNDYPEYESVMIDLQPERKKTVTKYTGSGTAVNINAANPELAMQVLDLMMNEQDLYDLVYYGIEGVHWTKGEDGSYDRSLNKELPDEEKYSCSNENWCFYNSNLKRASVTDLPEYLEMNETFFANAQDSKLSMFVFDKTPVEAEVAAIASLYDQYVTPILYGLVPDVDAAIQEAQTMLEIAGIGTVQEEVQRQLDDFWAK